MTVTPASLLSCLINSALLTVLAWVVIKNNITLKAVGRYIGVFLTVITVRMLLPVEFGFTVTFYSEQIMTRIRDMRLLEINVGGYEITLNQILLFLWVAGAAAGILIHAWEYLWFLHIVGRCPNYHKHLIEKIVSRINREYGKEERFKVLLVPKVRTPAILGLWHPKILMPANAYTEEELYYILKHEMLHYYQHDMLVKILSDILCTIYWWNPAVYLLRKLIARALEIRVDSLLASGLSEEDKTCYMECIVKSMKAGMRKDSGARKDSGMIITFASEKGNIMKQRFLCICEDHWMVKRSRGVLVAVISGLLFLLSISFVIEASYDVELPGTFDYPDSETSFLIEKDGSYEVYIDGEYLGDVYEITEPITELKIYKSMEGLKNEK